MNVIGHYETKPNAYEIGKAHENWAYGLMKNQPQCAIVTQWVNSLMLSQPDSVLCAMNTVLPQSHIEKTDFLLARTIRKPNGLKKTLLDGVSAKCGTTSLTGQIFRSSLDKAASRGLAPNSSNPLYELHQKWLINRENMADIAGFSQHQDVLLGWYQNNWNQMLEKTLFGCDKTTQASCLLMSNLNYNEKTGHLAVRETVLLHHDEVMKDLIILSNPAEVKLNLQARGTIESGIVHIQRAGGSNGEKGAEDWQARIDRNKYLQWLKINRPNQVWVHQ